jgi:N-acetylglucosaminylphosphatidylinositol deacetylase
MSATWASKDIVSALSFRFVSKTARAKSGPPEAAISIDTIITFDQHGVSSHLNHRSLYFGARDFVKDFMKPYIGWQRPIEVYSLQTTNMLRKYLSILDGPLTIIDMIIARKEMGAFPTPLFFVSTLGDYRTGQLAMTEAHKSQMVWFRWAWIGLSRYMVINDLKKEKI